MKIFKSSNWNIFLIHSRLIIAERFFFYFFSEVADLSAAIFDDSLEKTIDSHDTVFYAITDSRAAEKRNARDRDS